MCKNWLKNTYSSVNLKKGEVITSLLLLSLGAMAVGSFLGIRELQKDGKLSVLSRADSCVYSSTVTIKDEQGRPFNISGQNLGVSLRSQFTAGGKQYDSTEYFQNGSIVKNGQQLTEGFQNVPVQLTLNLDPNRYEIVNNFCTDTPPGIDANSSACVNDARSSTLTVKLLCGKTVDYGWTIRLKTVDPTACLYDSKAVLKDEQGRLITDSSVTVDSAFTTIVAGGREYTGVESFSTGQIVKNNTVIQPQFQDVPVQLKLNGYQDKYDIVAPFCNESVKNSSSTVASNGTACNNWNADTVLSTLRCNKSIEYGWVVKQKPMTAQFGIFTPDGGHKCAVSTDNVSYNTRVHHQMHGNIQCTEVYHRDRDEFEVSFSILEEDRGGELGETPLLFRTSRCTGVQGQCEEPILRQLRIQRDDKDTFGYGGRVQCFWRNPFLPGSDTPTCTNFSIPARPTLSGTVDSVIMTKGNATYIYSRSIDGCSKVLTQGGSSCTTNGMKCTPHTTTYNGRTVYGMQVQLENERAVGLMQIGEHKGCPCNEDGFCDASHKFIPGTTTAATTYSERALYNACLGDEKSELSCHIDGPVNCIQSGPGYGRCTAPAVQPTAAPIQATPTPVAGGAPVCAASSACLYPQTVVDEAGHSDVFCYTGRCRAGYENCGGPGGNAVSEQCTFAGTACGVQAVRRSCGNGDFIPTTTPRPGGGGGGNPQPTTIPGNPVPTSITQPGQPAQTGTIVGTMTMSGLPQDRWIQLERCDISGCRDTEYYINGETFTINNVPYGSNTLSISRFVYSGDGVRREYYNSRITNCQGRQTEGDTTCTVNVNAAQVRQNLSIEIPQSVQPQPTTSTVSMSVITDFNTYFPEYLEYFYGTAAGNNATKIDGVTNPQTSRIYTITRTSRVGDTLSFWPNGVAVNGDILGTREVINCPGETLQGNHGEYCQIRVSADSNDNRITYKIRTSGYSPQPGPTGTPGTFSWSGYLDIPTALAITDMDVKWYNYDPNNASTNHGAVQPALGELIPQASTQFGNPPSGWRRYGINVNGLATNKVVVQARATFESTNGDWYTFENCNSEGYCPVIDTTQGVRGFNLVDLSRPRDVTLPIYLDYFIPNLNITAIVRQYDETATNNLGASVALGTITPDPANKSYVLRFTTSGLPESRYYVKATIRLAQPFGTVDPFILELPCTNGYCLVDSRDGNIRINVNIPLEVTEKDIKFVIDLRNHPLTPFINIARTLGFDFNRNIRGYSHFYNEDGSMGSEHAQAGITEQPEINKFKITLPRFGRARYYIHGTLNLASSIIPGGLSLHSGYFVLDLRNAPDLSESAIRFEFNPPFTGNAASDLNNDGIVSAQDFLVLVRQSANGAAKTGTALKISSIFKDTGKEVVDKDNLEEVIKFYKNVEKLQKEAGLLK